MQLTLTKVIKKDKDKEGKQYISKKGQPYSRASILCNEYGSEYLNGFWDARLVEGATIDAEITEREYNGKTYKDFKLAKKEAQSSLDTERILDAITAVRLDVTTLTAMVKRALQGPNPEDYPERTEDPSF